MPFLFWLSDGGVASGFYKSLRLLKIPAVARTTGAPVFLGWVVFGQCSVRLHFLTGFFLLIFGISTSICAAQSGLNRM